MCVCVFLCHSLTEKESVYFTMVLLLPNSTASIFRDMSVYRDHKCMPVLKGVVLYIRLCERQATSLTWPKAESKVNRTWPSVVTETDRPRLYTMSDCSSDFCFVFILIPGDSFFDV